MKQIILLAAFVSANAFTHIARAEEPWQLVQREIAPILHAEEEALHERCLSAARNQVRNREDFVDQANRPDYFSPYNYAERMEEVNMEVVRNEHLPSTYTFGASGAEGSYVIEATVSANRQTCSARINHGAVIVSH